MEKQKVDALNYTDNEMIEIILGNIGIMLKNRRYEKADGTLDSVIDKMDPKEQGDNVWTLEGKDNVSYAIKIVLQEITVIGKQSPLSDFIASYPDHFKIIVALSYRGKVETYVNNISNAQIFPAERLMHDIASHELQPKFEPLSKKDAELVKAEYGVMKKSFPVFGSNDPMYKYFNMKEGDLFRIVRPSPASAECPSYRIAKN